MKLSANVTLTLMMRDEETAEQACDRLSDLLWSELGQLADHHIDFWVESTEVTE